MTAYVATTNQNLNEVGYRFYAPIASSRTISSSVNGFTWTTSGNINDAAVAWTGFAFGDELAVFIAANRTVTATTTPELTGGATNRATALPAGAAWKGLAFGNGTFITVNTSSTSCALFKPRAGLDWAAGGALPSAAAWNLIEFGNGTFVTVASGSTSSAYSTDNGTTWNPVALPATGTWTDLKYRNGKFILIGSGTRDIYTSTNGQSWSTVSLALPSTAAWASISWASMGGANGTWVVVPSTGTASAYSTDNGATWTSTTLPASANWLIGGGKAAWDGRQMFIALTVLSTNAAFSFDGITWTPFTGPNAAILGVYLIEPKVMTGDTLTINNGATLTVNTDQKKALTGASALNITNGKLRIENTSTTTPIRFTTNKLATAVALNTIIAASGLATVEVEGDYIQIGTSNGAAGQTFTSPYVYGDYIPTLEVETGSGTGIYELWTNVTGASDFQTYKYFRNGFQSVSDGDSGTCFTQDFNQAAVQYLNLANCNCIPNTNVITCTSTAGLVPGTWITGRGLAATCVVEQIISATIFTTNSTVIAANVFANIPIIGILPICSQYSTTLRFGDGTNGKIPPNGAKIRVQNILLTDTSTANFQLNNFASNNAGCYFTTPFGGVFTFNKCLFGESYSNYTQASKLTITNCGFAYVPFVSECYQVTVTNTAFGLPPSNMCLTAATALGATGSTNSTTTVTIPSSTAIIPGVLLTGTNLHACTVTTVNSATSVTVSTAAFGTAGTIAFTYYGNWVMREHRMNTGTGQSAGTSFTAIYWIYISGATFTNIVLTFGGHQAAGSSTNPGVGSSNAGVFSISYSNNVTVDGLKVIAVGSYPRTRPYNGVISTTTAGANQTFNNIKAYNLSTILTAAAVNTVSVSNITHKIGLHNEGYSWASGYRAFTNPETGTFLANDTKYWFKTKSYKSFNFADTSTHVEGMKMCGIMSAPEKWKQLPLRMGALPAWATSTAPTLAYGNGVWVALVSDIGVNTCLVSEDNGATWTSWMMPIGSATTGWWKVIWCPTQNYFMAIQGGGVASTRVAYSTNGKDWSTVTTEPASVIWSALAFDNSQATNKWVAVGGSTAVSTAGTRGTITNGSIVFAATTLASAVWIDVTSNSAGRYVAISGGGTASTATSYSTDGATWSVGGVNVSSLWQSIAYGNGTFCCVSASATNGPTACSADGVAWTAGTAPTLPTGMSYNKIIYTGTAFVLLAGTTPLNGGNPQVDATNAQRASQCYVVSTSNTATSITWGALKYLPERTHWISMTNNGNAVGVISTQTGKFAYTPDITAGTPTWTLYDNVYPVWNRISLLSQAQEYTTAGLTLTSVATTLGSTTVTCASTAGLYVGAVLTNGGTISGAIYFGTPAVGTNTSGTLVTSITNSTTFEISKPALRTISGQTFTIYKHAYQIFRSTTPGFTARDNTTFIGTTLGTGASSVCYFDDPLGVVRDTEYHYVVRKLSGSNTVANCSGTAAASTITTTFTDVPNPTTGFYYWQATYDVEGKNGTDRLTSLSLNFYAAGIVPGSIVTGVGIPVGTTVIDVIDFDTVRLSANLTADVKNRGNSRTYVGFSPAPGMFVYGSNVGMNCKVVTVDSNTSMTVSIANTNTFTTQTLRFVAGFELPEITCIPQAPLCYLNLALQNETLATAPWTASGITATNATGQFSPLNNFVGINSANPATTTTQLIATSANGTLTQTIQTGVGTVHTFALWARANLPDNRTYITMKMDLGTTSETKNLTNQWQRFSVSFTTTASTTNAVITLPAIGSSINVAHVTVTRTSAVPPPIANATTTFPVYQFPQQFLNSSGGLYGWNIDGGAGIETTLSTSPWQFWADLHIGTTPSFTPTVQNLLFSNQSPGVEPVISAITSAANINVSNYQPINTKQIHHGFLLFPISGATNVSVKDSTHTINGSLGYVYYAGPGYSVYLHNIDVINVRPYVSTAYMDSSSTSNASSGIKVQNVRSNRVARVPWYVQSLDTQIRGVFGGDPYPLQNGTTWNLSSEPTYSGSQITSQSVFDGMFREYTYGSQPRGCLDIRLIASSKASKPYTITSGTPFFTNDGNLALTTAGDQVVIEWPHFVKGLTGFTRRLPHIYSTDLGLNLVTSLGVLIEYQLDKGSGYGGTWKQLNGVIGMNNLADETGISPSTGVRPKFRITARPTLKYTAQVGQFMPGWVVQNALTSPTATAVVVDDEAVTTVAGSLVVSNITGEWLTSNTIYSGTMNTTMTNTTNASATTTGSNITGTTFTVGTQATGVVAAGMMLTGTNVLTGTYIVSNIAGSGSGSTWLVSKSHSATGTQNINGTNNLITLTSNANFYVGAGVVAIGTTFGGIASGSTNYVSEVIGSTQIAIATSFNNALAGTNATLSTASGSCPIGGIHSTITAVNTSFVFAPQPTSRLNSFRLFTETDTDTAYNYAYSSGSLVLTGLQTDSEVRVFRISDGFELGGTESSGTTFTLNYDYYENTDIIIVIHHLNYLPIRLEDQVLDGTTLTIPVQQTFDRQYSNPA
jgi:hypothetical protein